MPAGRNIRTGSAVNNSNSGIVLEPIGTVRNTVKRPQKPVYPWRELTSEIVIDERLKEALEGLEDFTHLIVLYWLHAGDRRPLSLKVHPRGNTALPLTGLMATRSPRRPNPIGKATVKLLERRDNILRVKGLDAIDGTPVLDIKPFIPGIDSAADASVPPWVNG